MWLVLPLSGGYFCMKSQPTAKTFNSDKDLQRPAGAWLSRNRGAGLPYAGKIEYLTPHLPNLRTCTISNTANEKLKLERLASFNR
jgi:hypothetical protein